MPQRQTVRKISRKIGDHEELLELLWIAARKGHVGAMRLLAEEHRRESPGPAEPDVIDELAERRRSN